LQRNAISKGEKHVNRLIHIAAAGTLLVFGAAAQDREALARQALDKAKAELDANMVHMKTIGAVKGMTVKGAPYSGEEVNETNQMLADGTRIHRENRTTVYRDSEGRTRRESPDNITITDPVANVTYFLIPKTMTGQKLSLAVGSYSLFRSGNIGAAISGDSSTFSIHSSGDGPATITVNGVPLDEKAVAEAMAQAKASGATQTVTYERREVTTAVGSGSGSGSGVGVGTGSGVGVATWTATAGGVMDGASNRVMLKRNAGESLGKQMVEGVNADGIREVSTIAAGAIGNDRPLQVSAESWYSAELQMNVMTKHSDPRTGDESFRLTNINRAEPGAYLFQAPAGYQITERK
jgi:hypothetical protein